MSNLPIPRATVEGLLMLDRIGGAIALGIMLVGLALAFLLAAIILLVTGK